MTLFKSSPVLNVYLFNAVYILMALSEGLVRSNTLAIGKPFYKYLDLFSGSSVPSCGCMSHWNTSDCLSPLGNLSIACCNSCFHQLENVTCIRFHPFPPSIHQLFIPEPWLVKTSGQQCLRQMSLMEAIWLIFQLYFKIKLHFEHS